MMGKKLQTGVRFQDRFTKRIAETNPRVILDILRLSTKNRVREMQGLVKNWILGTFSSLPGHMPIIDRAASGLARHILSYEIWQSVSHLLWPDDDFHKDLTQQKTPYEELMDERIRKTYQRAIVLLMRQLRQHLSQRLKKFNEINEEIEMA